MCDCFGCDFISEQIVVPGGEAGDIGGSSVSSPSSALALSLHKPCTWNRDKTNYDLIFFLIWGLPVCSIISSRKSHLPSLEWHIKQSWIFSEDYSKIIPMLLIHFRGNFRALATESSIFPRVPKSTRHPFKRFWSFRNVMRRFPMKIWRARIKSFLDWWLPQTWLF